MTKEQEPVVDAAKSESKEALVSSEKPAIAPAAAVGLTDALDEQERRLIIFGSVFLVLLAAPLVLPAERGESLWYNARYDEVEQAICVGIFGWPIFLGITSFWRGIRRKVPGKILVGMATLFTSLQVLATAALLAYVFSRGGRDAKTPYMWIGAVMTASSIAVVIRSFYRTGWQRWQHIMAALALLAVTIVLFLAGITRGRVSDVPSGTWVFLFAAAALVPFIRATVMSRKR
jgi:hypothetical protein